jgi:hypothetical protein
VYVFPYITHAFNSQQRKHLLQKQKLNTSATKQCFLASFVFWQKIKYNICFLANNICLHLPSYGSGKQAGTEQCFRKIGSGKQAATVLGSKQASGFRKNGDCCGDAVLGSNTA